MVKKATPSWSVAVFAARESLEVLLITLDAILVAIKRPATVNLLINGNETLATNLNAALMEKSITNALVEIRIWIIEIGDKACAWNQYIQHIWNSGELAFFVDGYARPNPSSFVLLENAMTSSGQISAATGLPSTGRTAKPLGKMMLATHGLHGNLYCISPAIMQHMKSSGFHLPAGIYRTDSTLGAAIKFCFDPANNEWNDSRVFVHPEVTWTTPEKHWWRFSDIKSQLKRQLRQAQGDLENRAVRNHLQVCKRRAESLPATALELVETWVIACPDEAASALCNPLHRHAWKNLKTMVDWSKSAIP
ncbi:MAG: hypothetical protein Q7U74_13870, partial [Saprospiraceae bacterium]|nr:hypothetical protein [Saprospiraceae bacterium]